MFNPYAQHVLYPVHHRLDHRGVREHRPLRDSGQLGDGKVMFEIPVFAPVVPADRGTLIAELEAGLGVSPACKDARVPVRHRGNKRVWDHVALAQDRYAHAFLDLLVLEKVHRDRHAVRVDAGFLVLPARFRSAHPLVQVALFDAVARADYRARFRTSHRGHTV